MAFKDDLKKYVDLAVDKSRLAFGKGKAAVTKFGDDSAVRIEKLQLEKKVKKETATLGRLVLEMFTEEGKKSVSASDEIIAASLRTITELKAEIAKKEDLLKKEDAAAQASSETAEKKDENS
ncbi:MAG: hypothetical protein IJP62_07680 [Treponema sp.]|nr:hypothetical protein [Treponema sp.]